MAAVVVLVSAPMGMVKEATEAVTQASEPAMVERVLAAVPPPTTAVAAMVDKAW
ncbi:hypothetical protein [Halomonas sp. NO4]|uniref:hypothetical protein n=1 Tax=Halomonas sp. NO4 TaxID=2484813 RepID=UPI0013D6BB54|nr:hypothetical protein [Halomonas sp. NO4]